MEQTYTTDTTAYEYAKSSITTVTIFVINPRGKLHIFKIVLSIDNPAGLSLRNRIPYKRRHTEQEKQECTTERDTETKKES